MAIYLSNQTGDWNTASTWLTAAAPPFTSAVLAGTPPQSNGGDKIIIRGGHTVTYNVSGVFGDDSTNPTLPSAVSTYNNTVSSYSFILSGGSLKASRLSSTSLTVRGTIYIGANSNFDWGTTSDPIPVNVDAYVYLNYSTSPATSKHGLIHYEYSSTSPYAFGNCSFTAVGSYRNKNTFLTTSAAALTSIITVDNVSGWKEGDVICLESDTLDPSRDHLTNIIGITGNNVGIQTGLNFARVSGISVGNFSSNVTFAAWSSAYPTGMVLRSTPGGTYQFDNVAFHDVLNVGPLGGATAGQHLGGISLVHSEYRKDLVFNNISSLGRSALLSYAAFQVIGASTNKITFNNCNARFNTSGTISHSSRYLTGALNEYNNYIFYRTYTNTWSNIVSNVTWNNCKFNGVGPFFGGTAVNSTFNNCIIKSYLNNNINISGLINPSVVSLVTFNNCVLSGINNFKVFAPQNAMDGTLLIKDCTFTNGLSVNGDILKTEVTTQTGRCLIYDYKIKDFRAFNSYYYYNNDYVERKNGITSIKFRNQFTSRECPVYFNIPAIEGVEQRLIFNLKYDTAFFNGLSSGTVPTINFYGTQINDTLSAVSAANTWTKFDYSFTPKSTENILMTLTMNSGLTGFVWLDGMQLDPFINDTRHYGFVFDKFPYRTINTLNTLTENQVSALDVVNNLDFLYDAASYWSTINPGLSSYTDLFFTNGTVLDFGNKNFIINNSGTGFLYTSATNTITLNAPSLSAGTNFNTLKTTGTITLSTDIISDIDIDASIIQNTPTNLNGVYMLNNARTFTYNTNSPIEVEYTDCNIYGLKNDGTAIVTVKKIGSTSITEYSGDDLEIKTYLPTLINLTLGTPDKGYIALYDNSSIRRYYQNTDGTIVLPASATGTWSYKVARYGYELFSGSFGVNPNVGGIIDINPSYVPDNFITQTSASVVSAYSDLDSTAKIHDYISYIRTTSQGIDYGPLHSQSFGTLTFNAGLTLNATASSVFDYTGGVITLKSSAIIDNLNYFIDGNFSQSNGNTISNGIKIRANNLDSEFYFANINSLTFYPTLSDRDNNTNPGLTIGSGTSIYRFLYGGPSISGVTFSNNLYIRATIGAITLLNTTPLAQGSTSLDFGDTGNIQVILNNQKIINQGVQKASKLIPHSTNI